MLGFLTRNNQKRRGPRHPQWQTEWDPSLCLPDLRMQRPSLHSSPLPASPAGPPSPHCACSLCGPAFEFKRRASPPPPRLCVGTSEDSRQFPPHPIGLHGTVHRGRPAAEARGGGRGLLLRATEVRRRAVAREFRKLAAAASGLICRCGRARRGARAARSAPGGRSGSVRAAGSRPEFLWPGRSRCAALSRGFSRFLSPPTPRPGRGTLQPSGSALPPPRFSASVP